MFRSLTVSGLGPIDSLDIALDPAGVTTLAGPSECGKSTAAEGLLWLLTGQTWSAPTLDVERIRHGSKEVRVSATTSKGTVIERSMTRSRRQTRRVGDAVVTTEAAFAGQLKAAAAVVSADGRAVPVARLVMAPMAWRDLLSSGGGRALRDVITPTDAERVRALVDERLVAGGFPALAGMEPIDPRDVEQARRVARSDLDRQQGALDAATQHVQRLERTPPHRPDEDDVDQAREVLAAMEAWREHDQATGAWLRALQTHEHGFEALTDWEARRAEVLQYLEAARARLQAHPPASGRLAELDAQLAAEERAVRRARALLAEARPDVADQRRELADAQDALRANRANLGSVERSAADEAPTCPTCGAAGYDWTPEVTRWREAVAAAEARVAAATDALEARQTAEQARLNEEVRRLDAVITEATAKAEALRVERDQLAQADRARAVDQAEEASALRELDRLDRQRPGKPPPAPEGERPAPPTTPQPTSAAVAEARATLADLDRAEGAIAHHARALAEARQRLQEAEVHLGDAQARAARAEALVEAVRAAPDAMFAEGVAAMGDLGDVTVRLVDGAVDVRVAGYPWHALSTGAQVRADAVFRAGLRRLLRVPWLPLVVDRVQDWTGPLDVAGPAILLVTEPGAGLVVR
jgi:hypothetical protein